jgi:hypothetical protein
MGQPDSWPILYISPGWVLISCSRYQNRGVRLIYRLTLYGGVSDRQRYEIPVNADQQENGRQEINPGGLILLICVLNIYCLTLDISL